MNIKASNVQHVLNENLHTLKIQLLTATREKNQKYKGILDGRNSKNKIDEFPCST